VNDVWDVLAYSSLYASIAPTQTSALYNFNLSNLCSIVISFLSFNLVKR